MKKYLLTIIIVYYISLCGCFSLNDSNDESTSTCRFGTSSKYSSSSNLGNTTIGDLNGDGLNDVVVIQSPNILIYYQNEFGKLDDPISINYDLYGMNVVIADINNDDKADLILAGSDGDAITNQGRVIIFLQDPAIGQLKSPQEYTVNTAYVKSIAVSDLNNDGLNDIVITKETGLAIFFQNTNGTLNSKVDINNDTVAYGHSEIHIGDMNNDGYNDIVVQSDKKELSVIMQISAGVFSESPDKYNVETSYWLQFYTFELGDLNGDGLTDIVAIDPGNGGYINIFLQNSSGKLDRVLFSQGANCPRGVEIADVNRDGLNDLIMDIFDEIVVFSQQSDHSFVITNHYTYDPPTIGGSEMCQALSIGDVTNDGLPDVVLTWEDVLYVLPYACD
jgi:hypothetical protein